MGELVHVHVGAVKAELCHRPRFWMVAWGGGGGGGGGGG